MFAMALILVSAFVFVLLPTANAGFMDWLTEAMEDILAFFVGGIHAQLVAEILLDNAAAITSLSVVNDVFIAMKVIGMALLTVYTLIEILNEAKNGTVHLDLLFKTAVKYVIGATLILFSLELVQAIEQGMLAITRLAADSFEDMGVAIYEEGVFGVSSFGFILNLVLLTLLRVALLPISWLIEVIIMVQAYSILIEVTLRKVFVPVAVASVVQSGERSPGVRYLKKFAAMYIRMAVMIGAFYLAGYMPNILIIANEGRVLSDIGQLLENMIGFIVFDLAAILFTSKAGKLADEIMGV